MRSSPLLLLLLIGQAVLNMGGGRALSTVADNHTVGQQAAANHRAGQQKTVVGDHLSEHHSSQAHQRPSHHRTRRSHRAISQAQERSPVLGHSKSVSPSDPSIPEVDPKLFSKRRFRSSSRVVFSEVPPSHEAQEGEATDAGAARGARVRRRAGMPSMHRGEYSVCDSISNWVGNRTMATDMAGNEVTVLPFVKIENVVKRQFFYETTCQSANHRVPGPSSYVGRSKGKSGKQGSRSDTSGCRGVDSKHWNSYCTNTQSFVSALTIFEKQTAWRNIRINVACVCVLTRRSWQGRVGR